MPVADFPEFQCLVSIAAEVWRKDIKSKVIMC
jgi:hypothetical protein